jgi:hypothetical protein
MSWLKCGKILINLAKKHLSHKESDRMGEIDSEGFEWSTSSGETAPNVRAARAREAKAAKKGGKGGKGKEKEAEDR